MFYGVCGGFFFTEKCNETQKPGCGKDDDGKIIYVGGQIFKSGNEHDDTVRIFYNYATRVSFNVVFLFSEQSSST